MPSDADLPAMLQLPPELQPVARLILARPDLQLSLGALRDPDQFAAEVQQHARQNGVPCDADCLRAALRPALPGMNRFTPAPVETNRWPGPGWLPARSVATGGEPAFDWLWFGPGPLAAPFFEDEVRRAEAMPLNWLLRTRMPLGAMIAGDDGTFAPPRGLIFHMSRCGSTLMGQMLGAIAGVAVSSEPEPLDAVLRWIAQARPPASQASAAIRAMSAALGRRLEFGTAAHLIKLEVWHTLFLPELRAALPDCPWIYLSREPVEVLVSQLKQPSLHIIPGALDPDRIGISGFDAPSHVDHAAQVIGRCMQAALDHWHLGGGLAVRYGAIPSGGALAAARHFALCPDTEDLAAMAKAAQRDAKMPQSRFSSDIAIKQAAVTDEVCQAAARWMDPVYRQIAQV